MGERITKRKEYQGFMRGEDGQPVVVEMESVTYRPDSDIEPVQPASIARTRARIPKRDYETFLVFGDAQAGIRRFGGEVILLHDITAINASLKLADDIRPNRLVDLGDPVDLATLGRHQPKDNHFVGTLQDSLQIDHNIHAEFTAATPGAERVIVDSNHSKRLGDYALRNAPELFDVRVIGSEYRALSYPHLLQLDKIGWRHIGGYGAAEYNPYDDLSFAHGTEAVSKGSTAFRVAQANPDRNRVQGHAHRIESQYHTDRHGRQLGAFIVGCLARTDGVVPGYHTAVGDRNEVVPYQENWQQGVMVIKRYPDGTYQFDQIPINDGVIQYNGRVYDGNYREE